MNILYPLLLVIVLILFAWIGAGVLRWESLFGIVFPCAAIIIFIIGIVYRVLKWASAPVPFNIPTVMGQQKSLPWIKANNIDSPYNTAGVVARMALDILLFRPLFRNEKVELKKDKLVYGGNKYLWLGALVFHWSLLIILFRHLRFFTEPVPSLVLFIQDIDSIFELALPTLYITNVLILVALTYLLLRRVIYPQIRYISLLSDYFILFLLLGVVLSGILMRLFFKVDITGVKELAMGILSFRPTPPEGIGLAFYIHLFLVSTLITYFPFSKMIHMAGILLSPTKNLMNKSRMVRHVNPWDYPVKVHTYDEYEDEFRKAMKAAGLPVEKEE